ncbi:MAG: hypothetical protein HY062_02005 [Bacteroidetes bacterium]|nr:hypothetical protein [Bacteroidota bacterium]
MSNTTENKEQTQQNKDKKTEEPKDWLELIQDFIKNPVTTGITGLAAGYLLGTYKASKDIEAIKAEHKEQMKEQNDLFKLLVKEIRVNNKLLASKQHQALLSAEDESDDEDGNTLEMVEDAKSKVYNYKPKTKKRIFEFKA